MLVGTAFVASEESNAHPLYKQKIVEASVDDTEYRTGYSFGWTYATPHRVMPNRDRWNLLRFIGGGARAIDKPRMAEKLSLYAGQGVGKIDAVVPAAQRVAELARGLSPRAAEPPAPREPLMAVPAGPPRSRGTPSAPTSRSRHGAG